MAGHRRWHSSFAGGAQEGGQTVHGDAALEGAVLFAKHLDGRVAFTQSAQLGRCVRMRRFEVTCMLRLVRELGAQHGPARLFCSAPYEVGLRGIVCGFQVQNSALWDAAVSRASWRSTVRDSTCRSRVVSSAAGAASFWDIVCEIVSYLSWRSGRSSYSPWSVGSGYPGLPLST